MLEGGLGQGFPSSEKLSFGISIMNNLTTQRQTIIKLLQDAGERGVSSYKLTYDHHIKQAPTRVYELRKLGFNIISKPHRNSVIYVLSTEPIGVVRPVVNKPQQWQLDAEAMSKQVQVVKNGRVYWEDVIEPRQEAIL